MPVLLLARGEKDARDLLIKAIEKRYGSRPPAFDSLKIEFTGRVHTRLGPLKAWVPLDLTARFVLPKLIRWDFIAKPAGVPVRRGIESYDGTTLRTLTGGGKPEVIEDPDVVGALQKRLWAVAALLLTPLGDSFVELKRESDQLLTATNMQTNADVNIQIADDGHLQEVYVNCMNVEQQKIQRFSLRPSDELVAFDNLLLPNKIGAFWDDKPWFEMQPTKAENDPDIPMSVFTLDAETAKE